MATEIEIEFDEFDDNDNQGSQDSDSTQGQFGGTPVSIEGNPGVPSMTQLFNPAEFARRKDKEAIKEQLRLQREKEKALKAQHRQELEAAKKQFKQRMDADKEQYKNLLNQSKSDISSVRSDAVGTRIGAYSLASALGLKGYVTASIADQFAIRPTESKFADESKEYQARLEEFQKSVAAERQREYEAQQEQIKQRQKQQLDALKQKGGQSGGGGQQPPFVPPTGQQPPPPPGQQPPPPGQNPPPPPVPPPPPGQQPPIASNPIPPFTPPTAPNIGGAALPLQALSATVQGLQSLNKAIDDTAKTVTSATVAGISGDGTSAAKQFGGLAKNIADPLGVNIPIQVAVSGFNSLLDINQGILESVKKNIEFSPQTLQADIVGELEKLQNQIRISMELDPITAKLVEANTQFDLAWMEFRAEVIRKFGPDIVGFLKTISGGMRGIVLAIDALSTTHPVLLGIRTILQAIAANTAPEEDQLQDMDETIFDEIRDFFDPRKNDPRHVGALKARGIEMPNL